jgi:hypothetical protein
MSSNRSRPLSEAHLSSDVEQSVTDGDDPLGANELVRGWRRGGCRSPGQCGRPGCGQGAVDGDRRRGDEERADDHGQIET